MRKLIVISMLIAVAVITAFILMQPSRTTTEAPSAEGKDVEVVVTETLSPTTVEVVAASSPSPTSSPAPPPPPTPTPASPPPTPDEYIATDGQQYVYVPGFGYISSGGESQVVSVPGMAEIGSMGKEKTKFTDDGNVVGEFFVNNVKSGSQKVPLMCQGG